MKFGISTIMNTSVKKQIFIINLLMICFGLTVASLTALVLSKLGKSHEEIKDSHQIALQAAELKSLVVEKGDAIKSLLLDPKNQSEASRKKQLDEKVGAAFSKMQDIASGTVLDVNLKTLLDFATSNLKANEDEIIKDLVAGRKEDASFKYVIQYHPLRATFEKKIAAFEEAAQALAEDRADHIKSGTMKVTKLVLTVQILGSMLLFVLMLALSRSLVVRLQTAAVQLIDASHNIRDKSAGQVEAAQELSHEMIQASSSLRETSSAAEEINQTVTRNVEMAETSKRLSEQGRRTVEKGHVAVENMLQSIHFIHETNHDMNLQLEGSFKELEKIVDLFQSIYEKTLSINEIVLQTRLLSFNASVEASRAGEHGKGFAVVAEEVGKLAHMSGQAAREIEDLLQNSSAQVTDVIKNVRSRLDQISRSSSVGVEKGTQSAENCREIFTSILNDVTQINTRIGEIFQSSREQAAGVREIAKSVQFVDNAIQKNTERAKYGANQTKAIRKQAEVLDTVVEEVQVILVGRKTG